MSESQRPVALVTGGARGIGRAVCRELVATGWRVVSGDIDAAAPEAPTDPAALHAIDLDVTSESSVRGAVDYAAEAFGRLDLLVNNAGIQRHGSVANLRWEDWDAVLDVNLTGVVRCMRAAARPMIAAGGGAVVNIASISAERGTPGRVPYVAAKAAVIGVTRTAAVEWAPHGVRVNAVGPGYVQTELIDEFVADGRIELDPILARTPMGRMATPGEIAQAIRFLGSPESSFITGQVLYVDGGFLADYGVSSAAAQGAFKVGD